MKPILYVLLIAAATLSGTPVSYAVPLLFRAALSGPNEEPPNASPGTGFANVLYNDAAHTLTIHTEFGNLVLTGTGTTVAHIHCCTAAANTGAIGVAVTPGTLPGFPVGVRSGIYDVVIDLTNLANYTGGATGFLGRVGATTAAQAEAALIAGFIAETAYFNIHSSTFPSGEIRGFLHLPEPHALALVGLGLLGLGLARRRMV